MATTVLYKYNHFYNTTDNYSIKNFTIYGERHSGTNWLEKSIIKNFHIPITWDYDWKHFFGCCNWSKLNNAQNTLFIGIVRNIYGWASGMKKIPYHLESNNIYNIKPWKSIDINCDTHWYDKKQYLDIFDMRHNKIEFLYLYMPYLVDNYIFIRYEDFIRYNNQILTTIASIFNLKKFDSKIQPDINKLQIHLHCNDISLINHNAIWNTENLIGYDKIIHKKCNLSYLTYN